MKNPAGRFLLVLSRNAKIKVFSSNFRELVNASSLEAIRHRIAVIVDEHGELDARLRGMAREHGIDEIGLRRLKKRKLQLKDELTRLQMLLVPDIHA